MCGGYDGVSSLNTVERYSPDSNRWKVVSPMKKHRSAGGVVSFQGYIYALGGHDGLSIFDSVSNKLLSIFIFFYLLFCYCTYLINYNYYSHIHSYYV